MRGSLFRIFCAFFLISALHAQPLDHPQQRWNYFYEQRRYPFDRIPAGARLTAVQTVRAMHRNARAAAIPQQPWTFIGPQPVNFGNGYYNSGRVASLAIDPRSDQTVYAGGAEGGVWKTTDGGNTWTPLTDDQPALAIGALALDPSNPDTIYAGTGEENFAQDSYSGVGILKSTDAGATWTNIPGPFAQTYIGAIAVHPTDGVTVLAASSIGLYQSADAGNTWTLVLPGISTGVFFDPAQPGVAWAAIGDPFGGTSNGVYRSTDSGASWTAADGAAPANLPTGITTGRIQIANVPTTPNSLYAIVTTPISGPGSSLRGVYQTLDAGAHWTKLNSVPDFCTPQCWYDLVIAAHPLNPQIVFAGGNVLNIRSLDGGNTWTAQGVTAAGLPHADDHAVAFTNDGAFLYLANDGGMFSSSSFQGASVTWNDLNATLALTEYYPNLSIDPNDLSITLAGSQDNGTHLYNGQLAWPLLLGGDGGWTAIDPSLPSLAYVSLPGIDLYRLQNLPSPTELIPTTYGINPNDRERFIAAWIQDPVTPQTMYFGTQYLYQSFDGGGVWNPISPDLTDAPPGTPSTDTIYVISTIAVAPANPHMIYTGSSSGAVYQSPDGGATWNDRSASLPTRSVTHISVDPVNPQTVYVTFSGYAPAGATHPGHVFESLDAGNTWTDISGNLPNLPVDDLVIDPDLPNTLYIATDAGVMATGDGGNTWAPLGSGFPNVVVESLVLHRATRTLRAATHGRSVWDYPLGAVSSLQPVISSLSPAVGDVGTGAFVLTIAGSNFTSSAHVWWNGQDRQVLSASATQITAQILAADIQFVGRASVAVFVPASGAGVSTPANFVIGPAPNIDPGGVVSSANPYSGLVASPGALLTIYGENLAGAPQSATNFPLPYTMDGVAVIIGNYLAPIYSVSPGAVNVQVPYELAPRSASVTLQLGSRTAVATITINAVSPALFSMDESGSGQGAIRIANTPVIPAPVGAFPGSQPAQPNDYLEIYCTGLGAVNPAVSDGAAAYTAPLSQTLFTPTVTIGGLPSTVLFSGLTPGFAGLYVVDVQIPANVSTGNSVPVTLTIGNVVSNTVTIAVQPVSPTQ